MTNFVKPAVKVYPNTEALAYAAAQHIAELSDRAIAVRGRFSIALSGGSTPRRAFETLASDEFAKSVEWLQWQVFWSDERAVPPEDPDSNIYMARRAFLDLVKIPIANIRRIKGELPPVEAAAQYDALLHDYFVGRMGVPKARFDLLMLGVGADGHIASLFPGTPALNERERWVVPNETDTVKNTKRVTLTLPAINQAAHVLFLVSGAEKADIVRRALVELPEGDGLPVHHINPDRGAVTWLLDDAAATQLRPTIIPGNLDDTLKE